MVFNGVWTSYFGSTSLKNEWGKNPNLKVYCVGNQTPSWVSDVPFADEFVPPLKLTQMFENGEINARQYCLVYETKILNKLDPDEMWSKYNGSVLCTWKPFGLLCNRHLIRSWFRRANLRDNHPTDKLYNVDELYYVEPEFRIRYEVPKPNKYV